MKIGRRDKGKLLSFLDNGERKVVELIVEKKPLEEIVERIGLPRRTVESLIHSVRFAFGANDDLIDDYLELLGDWQAETGCMLFEDFGFGSPDEDALISRKPVSEKEIVIAQIQEEWSAAEMRDLAASLLKLSDALDQDWSPENVRSRFHWPSGAATIERNSLELAKRATLLIRQRGIREKFLPKELFAEPGWNMLLDLFVQFAGGAKVSGKSLWISAGCPQSTAQRYVTLLEEQGLIECETSSSDGRVRLYSLTKAGVIGVGSILERLGR